MFFQKKVNYLKNEVSNLDPTMQVQSNVSDNLNTNNDGDSDNNRDSDGDGDGNENSNYDVEQNGRPAKPKLRDHPAHDIHEDGSSGPEPWVMKGVCLTQVPVHT